MPRSLDAAGAQLLSFAEIAERWDTYYEGVRPRLEKAKVPVIALSPGKLRVRLSELEKAEQSHA